MEEAEHYMYSQRCCGGATPLWGLTDPPTRAAPLLSAAAVWLQGCGCTGRGESAVARTFSYPRLPSSATSWHLSPRSGDQRSHQLSRVQRALSQPNEPCHIAAVLSVPTIVAMYS